MNRRLVHLLAFALCALFAALPGHAGAYCRRNTPAWTDATPIRVVINAGMENYVRHTYRDPVTGIPSAVRSCTSAADCGPDGMCATGFVDAPVNRCRGPRWTRAELVRSVQWVIGRINNESAANIPFVYLDTTDTSSCPIEDDCHDAARPWMNCFQFDTIVISSSECDLTAIWSATWTGVQWWDTNDSGLRNKQIRFYSSNDVDGDTSRGVEWGHFANLGSDSFEATLLHEMGHGLGLGHTWNEYPANFPTCIPNTPSLPNTACPMNAMGTCPIMSGDRGEGVGVNEHYFGYDDIQGLIGVYGAESTPDTRLFEDWDLTTANFGELATSDLGIVTNIAAAAPAATSASVVTVGGRFPDGGFLQRFQVWDWNWLNSTSTLRLDHTATGFASTGPIGVSVSGTHRTLSTAALRLTTDSRRYRRRLYDARHPLAGGSVTTATTNPLVGTPEDTAVPGVSTTFDPRSGSTIHAFRDLNGNVRLQGWRSSSSPSWSTAVNTGVRSYSHPSIACSPSRCFMAIVEMPFPITDSRETRLQWLEFDFTWAAGAATPTFTNVSGVTTTWNNITADPVASVVYNPSGGWYFMVTVALPANIGGVFGSRVFTYRHTEGSTSLALLLPQVADFTGIAVQPAAAGTGGYAEIFTTASP